MFMSEKSLPGQKEQPPEAVCSHCGRYVGPVSKCQYCGAPVRTRISLRFFRWAAVLLATVGLGLLYFMSIRKEVPLVQIGNIKNTMNFAYIHVEGRVPSAARVFRDGDSVSSVSFTLDDGTGDIEVKVYRKKAQVLVDAGKVPRAGDRIAMDGSLNVSADRTTLYLQVPENLEILEHAKVEKTTLGDISSQRVGEIVSVTCLIEAVRPPNAGKQPWILEIKDDTGRMKLTIWQSIVGQLQNSELLTTGTLIKLRAEVSVYRNKVRLKLNSADGIEFLKNGPADTAMEEPSEVASPVVPISEVNAARDGEVLTLAGCLGAPRAINRGVLYSLSDDSGRIELLIWDNKVSGSGREQLDEGVHVRISGKIKLYKGKLEIIPQRDHDIRIVEDKAGGS